MIAATSSTTYNILFMIFAAAANESGEGEEDEDEDFNPKQDKEDVEEQSDNIANPARYFKVKANPHISNFAEYPPSTKLPSATSKRKQPDCATEDVAETLARDCSIRGDCNNLEMFSSEFIIYEYSDANNQSFAIVDIFVPALSPKFFVANIAQDNTSILEFAMIMPTSMFLSKQLTLKKVPSTQRLVKEDLRVQSLTSEGHKILEAAQDSGMLKKKGVLGKPLRIQLSFHVEKELVSTKLRGHNHDEQEMNKIGQAMFIYSITVENAHKQRKLKMKESFMTQIASLLKGDSSDSDDDQVAEERAALTSRSKWRTRTDVREDNDDDTDYKKYAAVPTPMCSSGDAFDLEGNSTTATKPKKYD